MVDLNVVFDITEFVKECIQNGELTKDNYTSNTITSKLLTQFMKRTNLVRPKIYPIWKEVIRKSMLNGIDVSIDKSAMNEQKKMIHLLKNQMSQ